MVELRSVVTCPKCGLAKEETMPEGMCQIRYTCTNCGEILKPQGEDCCIFCTYGSVKCPPEQVD
jgi:hypothetical protein